MMKNIPGTFSIDFVCLQTWSFETVITIELLGHFPNKISKYAQLKHFANLSSKYALILQQWLKQLNLEIKSQKFLSQFFVVFQFIWQKPCFFFQNSPDVWN